MLIGPVSGGGGGGLGGARFFVCCFLPGMAAARLRAAVMRSAAAVAGEGGTYVLGGLPGAGLAASFKDDGDGDVDSGAAVAVGRPATDVAVVAAAAVSFFFTIFDPFDAMFDSVGSLVLAISAS